MMSCLGRRGALRGENRRGVGWSSRLRREEVAAGEAEGGGNFVSH